MYGEIERGKIPVLPRSRYLSPEEGSRPPLWGYLDNTRIICYILFVVVSVFASMHVAFFFFLLVYNYSTECLRHYWPSTFGAVFRLTCNEQG